jgi:hypothetical protein
VNIDYYVAFDGNFYSVPYNLLQEAFLNTPTSPAVVDSLRPIKPGMDSRPVKSILSSRA